MSFWKWSRIASSNASADPSINWVEGQPPSSVNDSARAMMAAAAKHRDDIAGAIATSGSGTAYTLSSYQGFDTLAHLDGAIIAFTPHVSNTDTNVTLNVDGLGAKRIRIAPNVEIQTGGLIQGTPYLVLYNNTDGAFYLHAASNYNSYSIPLGGAVPYFGNTAPNSSFALPFGQAINRITYGALFAIVGTNYGAGDGSSTFNLPDLRGRVIAGFDDMGGVTANRLSAVMNSTSFNGRGGQAQITLGTGNLPPYTPSGAVSGTFSGGGSTGAINQMVNSNITAGVSVIKPMLADGNGAGSQTTVSVSASGSISAAFTGDAQGGSSTPLTTVQPTMVANYILRII
jgi:microcystin-dependent protein